MVQKADLLTGEKFIPKRVNQQFATAQNRIRYHNKRASAIRSAKSYIDRPLHENFRILSALLRERKSETFHKQFLLGKGFNFFVLTHYVNYEGKTQKAIYNFTVVDVGNDQIKIIKNA